MEQDADSPNNAMRQAWRIENQRQHSHLGEYCTLTTSIIYPGGIGSFSQRIHDSASGYAEGQERVRAIIESMNLRLSQGDEATTATPLTQK